MVSPSQSSTTPSSTVAKLQGWVRLWYKRGLWRGLFAGTFLAGLAALTALDAPLVERWERELHTLFFTMRGPMVAPDDIVILAIDDESFSQAQHYFSDPTQHQALEPLTNWPWKRQAYAIAIERMLAAGAKAVAFDVLFTTESQYGSADDAMLAETLRQQGDQVVLATRYNDLQLRQGALLQPSLPIPLFLNTPIQIGTVNMPIDADNRIHQYGTVYLEREARREAALNSSSSPDNATAQLQTFAESTLAAAKVDNPEPSGTYINFYGPSQTFTHIPFWYVIDPDPWEKHLQKGAFFRDKIVLIGGTAPSLQDFHTAPFSETLLYPTPLAGVEIQANAIATLMQGQSLRDGLPQPWLRGLLVLGLGAAFGGLVWRINRPIARLGWTVASSSLWFGISYLCFLQAGLFIPAAVPILAMSTIGGTYILTDIVVEQLRKQRLRNTLARYVTSPIVQEIISQQDDFHDLLKAREAEVIGLLLGGRYRIVKLLGSGGFGETYVAQDTQRPGQPTCVVKQLKIISDDPKAHHLAQRLFIAEAETLEKLGNFSQIPRLLAHFEEQYSFYLVEEMIEGHLLRQELARRQPLPQRYVYNLLQDILQTVAFVHSQGVIHRDIKPANLIRRKSDHRLVLIDFGAVKQISNRLTDTEAQVTSTIGIGTQGYMPSEQSAGLPRFSSDLYAVGITAIEALTGIPPYAFKRDPAGEVIWRKEVPHINASFADILTQMVRYDFSARYQSAEAILADLAAIGDQLPDAPDTLWPLITDDAPGIPSEADMSEFEDSSTQVLPSDWRKDPEATVETPTAEF